MWFRPRNSVCIFALLSVLAVGPSARAASTVVASVPVELEWEQIAGAKTYELEFQNLNGKSLATFKSTTHIFKFKMKVGKYKVRSRVADERRVFGEWSELTEFLVEPKTPYFDPGSSARTTGKIDPRTLKAGVLYRWGSALGADKFRLIVKDAAGAVVLDETTGKFYFRAELPAGLYTATLSAIGSDEVASAPVVLSENLAVESVQLPAPEILFEDKTHLGVRDEIPLLRWKPVVGRVVAGTLEYRYFFGDAWLPVQKFSTSKVSEMLLEQAQKPGRYRLSLWAEAPGLLRSEPAHYEFVLKPKQY